MVMKVAWYRGIHKGQRKGLFEIAVLKEFDDAGSRVLKGVGLGGKRLEPGKWTALKWRLELKLTSKRMRWSGSSPIRGS